MGEQEARATLGVRLDTEGVAGAGHEVEDEAHDVGHGVGGCGHGIVAYPLQRWHEMVQDGHHGEIGGILYDGGYAAHDAKAYYLAKLLSLVLVHLLYLLLDFHFICYIA